MAVARRAIANAVRRVPLVAHVRCMSILAAFPHDKEDFNKSDLFRQKRGLDHDLNWSLAGDDLTVRGDAYRNPSVRDLLEFAGPRGSVKLTKTRRAIVATGGAAAGSAASAPIYATDALPGVSVVDVEDHENRLLSVRDKCLGYAPRLLVTDGEVAGGSRTTGLRVRFITDCPLVALAARALLHRTPLYAPECFPRTLTVYAATLADAHILAGESLPGSDASASGSASGRVSYAMIDIDPAAASGTVTTVGPTPLRTVFGALATAAGHLQGTLGGYRHVKGGQAQSPSLAKARQEGLLSSYGLRDAHYYADASEPHPALTPLANADIIASAGTGSGPILVIGEATGALASSAASKGRLLGAQGAVWHEGEGLQPTWAGLLAPPTAASSPAADELPAGSVAAYGATAISLSAQPRRIAHPSRIVVVGGKGTGSEAVTGAAGGLSDKGRERLSGLVASSKAEVVVVGSVEEALAAAGLK